MLRSKADWAGKQGRAGKQGWKGQRREGCQRWCAQTVVCWRGNTLVVDEPFEESREAESNEEESSAAEE